MGIQFCAVLYSASLSSPALPLHTERRTNTASRLDISSPSKCLKQPPKPPPRLRVLEVTRRRRTPTLPSAASLHTCSLPMSNVRMSVRKTQASASVKSAKSLVIGGRLLVRSSVSHEKKAATDKKRYE